MALDPQRNRRFPNNPTRIIDPPTSSRNSQRATKGHRNPRNQPNAHGDQRQLPVKLRRATATENRVTQNSLRLLGTTFRERARSLPAKNGNQNTTATLRKCRSLILHRREQRHRHPPVKLYQPRNQHQTSQCLLRHRILGDH